MRTFDLCAHHLCASVGLCAGLFCVSSPHSARAGTGTSTIRCDERIGCESKPPPPFKNVGRLKEGAGQHGLEDKARDAAFLDALKRAVIDETAVDTNHGWLRRWLLSCSHMNAADEPTCVKLVKQGGSERPCGQVRPK